MKAVIANPRKKVRRRSAAQKRATKRLVALVKARKKARRIKRKKNPAFPLSLKRKVRHRPVTYGSATDAGMRSPYKKLNPKRSSVMRKRRRKINPKHRRRVRRNPKALGIKDMLVNSAISMGAFVGGMYGGHVITKAIAEGRNWNTQQKSQVKNIVRLALCAVAAFVLPRYLDEKKSEAVLSGLVIATGFGAMRTMFGTSFDELAGIVEPQSLTLALPEPVLSGQDVFNVSDDLDLSGIVDMDYDLTEAY